MPYMVKTLSHPSMPYMLLQDIDHADNTAQVIRMPKDALKIWEIMLLTDEQWMEKLAKQGDV